MATLFWNRYTTDELPVSITREVLVKPIPYRYTTDKFQVSITTTLCKNAKTLLADSFFAIVFTVKTAWDCIMSFDTPHS